MAGFKDLKGQKFGELEVIEYLGDRHWLCRCSCNREKRIHGYSLTSGKTKSCGKCNLKEVNVGDTFGDWTVTEVVDSVKVMCKCSCNKEREVNKYSLLNGTSTGCGHNKNKDRVIDISEQKFGELVAKKYLGDSLWECLCSCGNTCKVKREKLISGYTTHCKDCTEQGFKDIKDKRFGNLTAIKHVGNKNWLCHCECGKDKVIAGANLRNGSTISCGCALLEYRSLDEKEIANTLEKYVNVEVCNRDVIRPLELDIYIPSKKLAIEYNGSYWHSESVKDKYYHQNKTVACMKKGVQLIHIFEYEWKDITKKDKIMRLILNKVTDKDKIKVNARNTIVKHIDVQTSNEFLEKYHLQGKCNSSIRLGCFTKDTNELIGVMTFGVPRFNSKFDYELIRLCWKDNIVVRGGAKKIFKHFVKTYNPDSVISYCDISKFNGEVYSKLGFRVNNEEKVEPNYIWWNHNNEDVLTRYQTQKHKLIEKGLGTKEQTEVEIMTGLGYTRIYDSGNLKFEWRSNIE